MSKQDELIRIAAFEWLHKQTLYDEVLSRNALQEGFEAKGLLWLGRKAFGNLD